MAITKAALAAKRKKLADLIRKGRDDYPNVMQTRGFFLRFTEDEEPKEACAIGFAMLGKWDGKLNRVNANDYAMKIEETFSYRVGDEEWDRYYITPDVIEPNDQKKLSLDDIIAYLETE